MRLEKYSQFAVFLQLSVPLSFKFQLLVISSNSRSVIPPTFPHVLCAPLLNLPHSIEIVLPKSVLPLACEAPPSHSRGYYAYFNSEELVHGPPSKRFLQLNIFWFLRGLFSTSLKIYNDTSYKILNFSSWFILLEVKRSVFKSSR